MKQRCFASAVVLLVLMGSIAFAQDNRRTGKFSVPVSLTGQVVGQCGNFDVLSDWTALWTGTVVSDKSGEGKQTIQHIRILGESIYYNSSNPDKFVLGIPGEHENDRLTSDFYEINGPVFKIRVPGYGVIFAETGHAIFDIALNQYVFNSGQNQMLDQDLTALCEYLK